MLFLTFNITFSNVNMLFAKQKFTSRLYTLTKVLSLIERIQTINQKKFTITVLDLSK